MIEATFHNMAEVEAALAAAVAKAEVAGERAAAEGARVVQEAVRARAPRRTGRLADSVKTKPAPGGAAVVMTAPYGGRVDRGFRGTDRLGRHYNEAGRHFVAPGVDEALKTLGEIAAAAWREALR